MIGMLMALAAATSDLSGFTVSGAANPDYNLVSRNILPDGTLGECRKVMADRPGWLTVQCETGPFLGNSVYHPLGAPAAAEAAPAPSAVSGGHAGLSPAPSATDNAR